MELMDSEGDGYRCCASNIVQQPLVRHYISIYLDGKQICEVAHLNTVSQCISEIGLKMCPKMVKHGKALCSALMCTYHYLSLLYFLELI